MIDDHSDEEEEKDGDDDEDEDYTNLMNRLKMAEIQSKIHIFERNVCACAWCVCFLSKERKQDDATGFKSINSFGQETDDDHDDWFEFLSFLN